MMATAAVVLLGLGAAALPAQAQGTNLQRLSGGGAGSYAGVPVVSPNGRYVAFEADVNGDGLTHVYVYDRDDNDTELASVSSSEEEGNGPSHVGGVSNGGLVVFSSQADNLSSGDGNSVADIFVRDLGAGTTERIGYADANEWGGGNAGPTISADGSKVAFLAWVPGDFFSGAFALHLYDRNTNTTDVLLGATFGIDYPVISANGEYVAFHSGESHHSGDTDSLQDVYLHEVDDGSNTPVSTGTGSWWRGGSPAVSHDGQYVAYHWFHCEHFAPLTTCNTDDAQVMVYDRSDGSTHLVSKSSGGTTGNGQSIPGSISATGRYVSFLSDSTNLALDDTNGVHDVFVRDRTEGITTRVSVPSGGGEADNVSLGSAIGPGGGFIAFDSYASNLTSGDTIDTSDVFLRDL